MLLTSAWTHNPCKAVDCASLELSQSPLLSKGLLCTRCSPAVMSVCAFAGKENTRGEKGRR